MNKLLLRKIHRWLGLIAGVQLLAWTVSGLYFTIIPIDNIHGDHLLNLEKTEASLLKDTQLRSPSTLIAMHPELADATISDVRLTETLGTPIYLIAGKRINATTGEFLSAITESEARAVATARTNYQIVDISLIEEVAIDAEYRGGELPAWRITLAEEDAALYIGTTTGRIRAVRTNAWRLFDFLWSLHIMDYEERDNFNHLLIQAMAILGLITVLSGLTLFAVTWRRKTS